jgi:hypothetical protein
MVVAWFTTADRLEGATTGVGESDTQNAKYNRLTVLEQRALIETTLRHESARAS